MTPEMYLKIGRRGLFLWPTPELKKCWVQDGYYFIYAQALP